MLVFQVRCLVKFRLFYNFLFHPFVWFIFQLTKQLTIRKFQVIVNFLGFLSFSLQPIIISRLLYHLKFIFII